MDFPIKNGDFPLLCKRSPEGNPVQPSSDNHNECNVVPWNPWNWKSPRNLGEDCSEMNEHLRFTVNSLFFWLNMDQDIIYKSLIIQYINL